KFDLTDGDGHTSTFTKDVVVLSTPTVVVDSVTTDTGNSSTDFITADRTLVVNGTLSRALQTGETLTVSVAEDSASFTALAASKVTVSGTSVSVDDGLTPYPTLFQSKFDLTDGDGHTSTFTKDVVVLST